jgi:FkbM family methyltransferase
VWKRAARFYGLHVRRDPFLRALAQWFADDGDRTLRLDYPLDDASVVFDVGGYRGDFCAAIHARFRCRVFVFEPVAEFYAHCAQRFRANPSITCLDYGLAARSQSLPIYLDADASSTERRGGGARAQRVQVRAIADAMSELGVDEIDLLKINIEGGEFELIPALVETGLVERVRHLQVQFHDLDPGSAAARERIRASLCRTHREMWCYPFVWESWQRI